MALFKILKGNKSNLDKLKKTEGYCYFTKDENKLYVDVDNNIRVALNAASADQLKTARTIQLTGGITGTATSFDGSKNISIPVPYVYDIYTRMKDRGSLSGAVSALGSIFLPESVGNRLADIPSNKIYFQTSIDGGETWSEEQTFTSNQIMRLVNMDWCNLKPGIGFADESSIDRERTENDLVRVIIKPYQYCLVQKIFIKLNSRGAQNTQLKIEGLKVGATDYTVLQENLDLSGWPGWNEIGCYFVWEYESQTTVQQNHYQQIRLTFSGKSNLNNYLGWFQIQGLRFIGPTNYYDNGPLSSYGIPYKLQIDRSVKFIGNIYDSSGKSTSTNDYTDEDKEKLTNLYSNQVGQPGTAEGAEIFNLYAEDEGAPGNEASGFWSHAEGYKTAATSDYSHTEGYGTETSGQGAHAEGDHTIASGFGSHAEGMQTVSTGHNSHSEGELTVSEGACSHTEGVRTKALEIGAHAEGNSTTASSTYQHVQGKYNIEDTEEKYAHIVGNGTQNERSNAHTLDWDGNAWFAGNIKIGGTSYDDEKTKNLLTTFNSVIIPYEKLYEYGYISQDDAPLIANIIDIYQKNMLIKWSPNGGSRNYFDKDLVQLLPNNIWVTLTPSHEHDFNTPISIRLKLDSEYNLYAYASTKEDEIADVELTFFPQSNLTTNTFLDKNFTSYSFKEPSIFGANNCMYYYKGVANEYFSNSNYSFYSTAKFGGIIRLILVYDNKIKYSRYIQGQKDTVNKNYYYSLKLNVESKYPFSDSWYVYVFADVDPGDIPSVEFTWTDSLTNHGILLEDKSNYNSDYDSLFNT